MVWASRSTLLICQRELANSPVRNRSFIDPFTPTWTFAGECLSFISPDTCANQIMLWMAGYPGHHYEYTLVLTPRAWNHSVNLRYQPLSAGFLTGFLTVQKWKANILVAYLQCPQLQVMFIHLLFWLQCSELVQNLLTAKILTPQNECCRRSSKPTVWSKGKEKKNILAMQTFMSTSASLAILLFSSLA